MRRFLLSLLMTVLVLPLLSQQDKAPAATKVFQAYDLYVNISRGSVAAWQLEIKFPAQQAKIVGIGGGSGVFSEPADYDSKALTSGRIILAAYSLEKDLPSGRVHLGRLQTYENKGAFASAEITLQALADAGGKNLNGHLTLEKVKGNER